MELLERYLHAVGNYLPKAQAADITAELKDSLLSKIEEQENQTGRALNDDELRALIKANGHPMLVASQYLPQQQLIGPTVFPYWWFSLRLVLMIIALVHVVLVGIAAVTSGNPIQAIIQGFFEFAGTALVYAAVLTLIFSLLERQQVRFCLFENWQPEKLAPIKDSLQIPRCESGFELVVGAVFVSWWLGLISFPTPIFHDGVALPFKLSAAWQPYWWGILLLAVMDVVLAAANWLKPYWKWDRLLLRILINVISLALVYILFQQDELVVLADATVQGDPARIVGYINQAVHGVLVFIALVSLIELVQDVRRLLTLR